MIPALRSYRLRRLQAVPALATLVAVALLLSLGVWQLQRLAVKERLITQFNAAQTAPPVTELPLESAGLVYRRVDLTGEYLYAHTLLKAGAYPNARTGYYLLTPFKDATTGTLVIVSRGFVPGDKAEVEKEELAAPRGPVEVKGILREGRKGGVFLPKNQPEKNLWFSEDIAQMQSITGLSLAPLMVEAEKTDAGTYPLPNTGGVTIRNDHLGYAITWFLLAVICVVMAVAYHVERRAP